MGVRARMDQELAIVKLKLMSEERSRTNPYRFGVLEGNHAEDRIALDLLAKQARGPLPQSTMKDDYRWFNSVLFEQREAFAERFPELAAQLQGHAGLQRFAAPAPHLAQQERVRANLPAAPKHASGEGPAGIPATGPGPARLMVCCGQGTRDSPDDAMQRHGVLQDSAPPAGLTGAQALARHNAPENGRRA